MTITCFEDIEGWQEARKLCRMVGEVLSQEPMARSYAIKDQLDRSAGSVMDNIAEGFDGGSNAEFIRFLCYAQRSASEVKSQVYRAADRGLITTEQFDNIYKQASITHNKIGGFIRYLKASEKRRG
jgi:four helix bundle protein